MSQLKVLNTPVEGRSCVSIGCNACCKYLAINGKDAPDIYEGNDKPAGEWCKQCDPGAGCMTYDDRPDLCHQFNCLWLTVQQWPEQLNPRKSGIVATAKVEGNSNTQLVSLYETRPGASTNPRMDRFMQRMWNTGICAISVFTLNCELLHLVAYDDNGLRHNIATLPSTREPGKHNFPVITKEALAREAGRSIERLKEMTRDWLECDARSRPSSSTTADVSTSTSIEKDWSRQR